MLIKEFYDKATTGVNEFVLNLYLAEILLKDKVKTLTPVTVDDIEESETVDNHYQIDGVSFLYRASEKSYYIEEVKEDGINNIVQAGFDFVLYYIIYKTLARYF